LALVGIDVGGTSAKLGLIERREIRARRQIPTGRSTTFEWLVEGLAGAVAELCSASSSALEGIGVAAPGFSAADGSGVVNVTNLPHIDGQPLRDRLSEALGLPVRVDNDANAAALGEFRYGAGGGAARLLLVTVGTGIGAGMVVGGEILRVAWQGLGDPGHIVLQRDGPRCDCGATGCLEALAAAPATLRRAAGLGQAFPDFPSLVDAATGGDGPGRQALLESAAWLGAGLATYTHLLAPDRLLLGGGVTDAAAHLFLPAVVRAYQAHVQPFLRARVTLARAALGNDAGVLGAAALAAGAAR